MTAQAVKAVLGSLNRAQVLSIAHADAPINFWHGAISSGKTIGSLLAWLIYVADAPRGGELVVVGRTRESIARNVFGPLADPALFGTLATQVTYTSGAPTAKVLGRTVHVLGASDARSENVLRGLTCAGAYVDEATLVSEAFWTQLLGRMRVPGAKIFATTNPDGPSHYLRKQVIARADELGYAVFKFKLEDNRDHLDPAYYERVQKQYTGLWHRRFILGEWVQAQGAIYETWDPARHVVPTTGLPRMDRVLTLGADYGDRAESTRGYLLGVGPDTTQAGGYRLYVLDEWAPSSGTVGQQSTSLRAWLAARQPEQWRSPEWVAVDSAALAFKHQLFHDGLVNVRNAHKNVLSGIRTVSAALAVDKLVVADTCEKLIEAIPGYVWDEKAAARGETRPVKEADHEVDALRYAVYTSRHDWADLVPLAPADAPDQDTDDEP